MQSQVCITQITLAQLSKSAGALLKGSIYSTVSRVECAAELHSVAQGQKPVNSMVRGFDQLQR